MHRSPARLSPVAVFERSELGMQTRQPWSREAAGDVVQFERVSPEVVELALSVRILDVEE